MLVTVLQPDGTEINKWIESRGRYREFDDSKQYCISCPAKDMVKIDELAKENGMSRSEFIRYSILGR